MELRYRGTVYEHQLNQQHSTQQAVPQIERRLCYRGKLYKYCPTQQAVPQAERTLRYRGVPYVQGAANPVVEHIT